jgi:hypothetical protein
VNNRRPTRGKNGIALRWMARGLGVVTSGVFLLIIALAITNEDAPRGPAIPVLFLLGLTLVTAFAAWRWERVGGLLVILLAGGLTVAAYSASRSFGLGSASFLPAFLYGGPFLVVGALFLVSSRITPPDRIHPNPNHAADGPSARSW